MKAVKQEKTCQSKSAYKGKSSRPATSQVEGGRRTIDLDLRPQDISEAQTLTQHHENIK